MNAHTPKSLLKARGWIFSNLLALSAISLVVYVLQLSDTNAYMGYKPLVIDSGYVLMALGSLLILSVLLPTSIARPSDFFCLFYGLFVAASYVTFHPVAGQISNETFLVSYGILLIPLVLLRSLAILRFGVDLPRIVSGSVVERLVLLACVIGAAVAIANSPESAGFGIETMYDRRLEARDIFVAGSPFAYLTAMVSNGFLPFLSFAAGRRRRIAYLFILVLLGLVFFYVFGKKFHILFIVMAYAVGYGVNRWDSKTIPRALFVTIWILFAVFVIERLFVSDITVTGEFFFRRAFSGPAQLIANYFDLIFGQHSAHWDPLTGAAAPDGVAFLIGDLYFQNPNINANTNAFIHALASGGIPAFVGTIVLTLLVFALLNASYRSTNNSAFIFLGFSYGLLLTEQAATTALATSGIGVLIALVCMAPRSWISNNAARVQRSRRLLRQAQDREILEGARN